MEQATQTILYCTEGSSDKEYRVQIETINDQCTVNFQYGRKGQALKSGTKTSTPVPFEEAFKIYHKLIQEKISKGYIWTTQDSADKYIKPYTDRAIGNFLPQLLNEVEESEMNTLLDSADWCVQEKMDGDRRSIQVSFEGVIGLNRKGLVVDLPEKIASEIHASYQYLSPCIIDGEIIGDHFHAFDVIFFESNDFEFPLDLPFENRYHKISRVSNTPHVSLVVAEFFTYRKRGLVDCVKLAGKEGVVFKHISSVYRPGRPNSGGDWLKLKYVADASCIVLGQNLKRSVSIGLYENGHLINVGNVTIPPSHAIPVTSEIVNIRYLYAYKGGSLFQPRFLGVRTDIENIACVIDQLKFKAAA